MNLVLLWIFGAFVFGTIGGYFIGKYEERRNTIEFIREINIADLMDILVDEIENGLGNEKNEEDKEDLK